VFPVTSFLGIAIGCDRDPGIWRMRSPPPLRPTEMTAFRILSPSRFAAGRSIPRALSATDEQTLKIRARGGKEEDRAVN